MVAVSPTEREVGEGLNESFIETVTKKMHAM